MCTPRRELARRSASTQSAVDLAFERHDPPEPSGKGSLVMLHGLFGSSQNWRSLGKALSRSTGRSVHCLDLRNHGNSPHVEPADYTSMAGDVSRYLVNNELQDVVLVGHSMGGKVAMALALSDQPDHADRLARLVSVDMAPNRGKISDEFASYIDAFRAVQDAIEAGDVSSKSDADKVLERWEPTLAVRQFLATNLVRPTAKEAFRWRIPVDILARAIPGIGDFPYASGERTFDRPTLFIKGAKSKYINRKNEHLLREFFPHSKLEVVDAGHWVHSERPADFQRLIVEFAAEA